MEIRLDEKEFNLLGLVPVGATFSDEVKGALQRGQNGLCSTFCKEFK